MFDISYQPSLWPIPTSFVNIYEYVINYLVYPPSFPFRGRTPDLDRGLKGGWDVSRFIKAPGDSGFQKHRELKLKTGTQNPYFLSNLGLLVVYI